MSSPDERPTMGRWPLTDRELGGLDAAARRQAEVAGSELRAACTGRPLRVLNLGAGVQSSAILLMACAGELPRPDVAIFADTTDEPPDVYAWLGDVLLPAAGRAGIPVAIVRSHLTKRPLPQRLLQIPAYVPGSRGHKGAGTPVTRSCTQDWKIAPINRAVKAMLGLAPKGRWPRTLAVETWLGISVDEITRMKASTDPWQRFWHPLIEQPWTSDATAPTPRPQPQQLGLAEIAQGIEPTRKRWAQLVDTPPWRRPAMSREDCARWLLDHGYGVAPRSACVYCPFHGNAEWRRLRDEQPAAFARAVEADRILRLPGQRRRSGAWLHVTMKPLDQVQLDDTLVGLGMDNECSGVCGV